jgi:hypothetical protein
MASTSLLWRQDMLEEVELLYLGPIKEDRALYLGPIKEDRAKEVPNPIHSKGMFSVDYILVGFTIGLRPSIVTPSLRRLCKISKLSALSVHTFLNRPLIMLLEGLGVPYRIVKRYQEDAVQTTRMAASSLCTTFRVSWSWHFLSPAFHPRQINSERG